MNIWVRKALQSVLAASVAILLTAGPFAGQAQANMTNHSNAVNPTAGFSMEGNGEVKDTASVIVQTNMASTKRIFVMYAFMGAGGYSQEAGRRGSAFRCNVVDAVISNASPELLEKVRAYYVANSHVSFGVYSSYALHLQGTGPFTESPEVAGWMPGLLPLLNEFYTQARVDGVWAASQGEMEAHLEETMPLLAQATQDVFDYARDTGASGRAFVYVPNLLESYNQAMTITIGKNAYIVVGPHLRTSSLVNTYRHEVAHHVVTPPVAENLGIIDSKRGLFQNAPGELKMYYGRWNTFVGECLVRAITIRLAEISDPLSGEAGALQRSDRQAGFFLVDPFVEHLKAYEVSGMNLREYATGMFETMM